jgi:hypothetical protein
VAFRVRARPNWPAFITRLVLATIGVTLCLPLAVRKLAASDLRQGLVWLAACIIFFSAGVAGTLWALRDRIRSATLAADEEAIRLSCGLRVVGQVPFANVDRVKSIWVKDSLLTAAVLGPVAWAVHLLTAGEKSGGVLILPHDGDDPATT